MTSPRVTIQPDGTPAPTRRVESEAVYLALAGVDNWVESLFNGCALVFAVGLSTVLGRRLSGG